MSLHSNIPYFDPDSSTIIGKENHFWQCMKIKREMVYDFVLAPTLLVSPPPKTTSSFDNVKEEPSLFESLQWSNTSDN